MRDITLTCKCCEKELPYSSFSTHSGCKSGYDTSRCKPCKKSKADWSKVPINRKIFNRAKSRAKRLGRVFNITIDDIVIGDKCPVFGVPFKYGDTDWTYSLDRVDNSLGYIKGNVVVVSLKANRIKNSATVEELETIVKFYKEI